MSGDFMSTVVLGHWCQIMLPPIVPVVFPPPQGSQPLPATSMAFLSSPGPRHTKKVAPGGSSSICWPWGQSQGSWGHWRLQWGEWSMRPVEAHRPGMGNWGLTWGHQGHWGAPSSICDAVFIPALWDCWSWAGGGCWGVGMLLDWYWGSL